MARFYPVLTETQLRELPSQAEAKVYCNLRDNLDDSWVIIHGQSYVAKRKDGGFKDGEADFLIFSAKHGFLVVEVKGGGISFNPSIGWFSIDRKGIRHKIKDPVGQAKSQKYAVLDQLQASQPWCRLRRRITIGHAVLFPDLERVAAIRLPDCPNEIVGGKGALRNIASWLNSIFLHWKGRNDTPLGSDGLQIVEEILCQHIEVSPILRDILDSDDKVRVRLTNEQASVLRTLYRHKRAAIVGAAGTGKTILAVEKARSLAKNNAKVLLLCYNKPLGVMLRRQFDTDQNVMACTFHQFCLYCVQKCNERGLDVLNKVKLEMPTEDYYEIQLPVAAYYAIEKLSDELQFDAIIVDEGQDFGEEYWLPIEEALRDAKESFLYIFYDDNQQLYSRVSSFPIESQDTFLLTKNCRNSKPVHELAYKYYKGEPVDGSNIEGVPPIWVNANSIPNQANQIARYITRLIHDEGVNPESIAVLIGGSGKERYYNLLKCNPLPRQVSWSREEHFRKSSVLMDTIKRFKGLERDIIFLWVDRDAILNEFLMYVGISRAKSVLYLVGEEETFKISSLTIKDACS